MTTLDWLASAIAHAIRPLAFSLRSDGAARRLVARLGWELPAAPVPASLTSLSDGLVQLYASTVRLRSAQDVAAPDDPGPAAEALAALTADLALVIADLRLLPGDLRDELPAEYVAASSIDQHLERRLFELLISLHLERVAPVAYGLLRVAGIVEVRDEPADPAQHQPAFQRRTVRWHRIPQLLRPRELARDLYGWGSPAIDTESLFDEIVPLSFAIGMPAERRYAAGASGATHRQLWIQVVRSADATLHVVLGAPPSNHADEPQAISVTIVPSGSLDAAIQLGDGLELAVEGAGQMGSGISLVLRPDRGVEAVLDVLGESAREFAAGRVGAWLVGHADDWDEDALASDPGGGRFTARAVKIGLGASAVSAGVDAFAELEIQDGEFVLAAPSDDGLLSSVLPPNGISIRFSAALRWSREGFHFRGSTDLSCTIPVAAGAGPVRVHELTLTIGAGADDIRVRATASAELRLGPVLLAVDGCGLELEAAFRPGNLGPLDVGTAFVPPTGAGVQLNAPLVRGGGFISFDHEAHRYAGVLAVDVATWSARAFGVLDTRPPGGGFAFAAVIGASLPRIPIGWGFTLDAIGGVVALHRRVDVDAIREGLRGGTIASLLFPADVVGQAPTILRTLARYLPPAHGRHVVGPAARIGWHEQLVADVFVGIELPAPVRVILLGAIRVGLPTLTRAVVDLRLDALGVLDIERRTLALDASLHDSKLAGYELTGDMALRVGWGDEPHFLLAIGGFHPRFTPPPGFPALRRLSLTAGDNPQFRLEAYLALTSNTAQVGAHAELTYAGNGFDIHGQLGFDALFEFVPFHFEVDITASASISYRGHNLSSVELAFLLTGPRPWHATGQATFSIWRWEHSVDFDATWGNATPASLPPPPDVATALREALEQAEAWIATLPDGELPWIDFAAPSADDSIKVHPLAELTVRQRAMPLDYDITQFGNVPLPSPRRFSIQEVRVGGEPVATDTVEDRFARGQFTRLSSEQRLSAPSFERFHAGKRLGADEVRLGPTARAMMDTDTVVDDPLAPPTPPARVKIPAAMVALASAVRSTVPATPPRTGPRVRDLAFTLASTVDLSLTALGSAIGKGAKTYGALREALNRYVAETGHRPPLQVVPRVEMASAGGRVVVVREDDRMRNVEFVDTETGRAMTRAELVDAIHAGEYPQYTVRTIHGLATPVSRPNSSTDDNLG